MTDEDAHSSSDMPDIEGLNWANPENALLALGRYIDTCFRNGNRAGTNRALNIIQRIDTADWTFVSVCSRSVPQSGCSNEDTML